MRGFVLVYLTALTVACNGASERGYVFLVSAEKNELVLLTLGTDEVRPIYPTAAEHLTASDRSELAFVSGNEVLTSDLAGHVEQIFAAGLAPAPKWRSAGWLTFITLENGIYKTAIAKLGQQPRTVATTGPVALSPDASKIAYGLDAAGGTDVVVEDTDGANSRVITTVAASIEDLFFSADGNALIGTVDGSLTKWSLDSTDVQNLGTGRAYGTSRGPVPPTSYDGDHVLVEDAAGLSVMSLSSSERTLLMQRQPDWYASSAFFLADGRVLHSVQHNIGSGDVVMLRGEVALIQGDGASSQVMAAGDSPCQAEVASGTTVGVVCGGAGSLMDANSNQRLASANAASLVGLSRGGDELVLQDESGALTSIFSDGSVEASGIKAVIGGESVAYIPK